MPEPGNAGAWSTGDVAGGAGCGVGRAAAGSHTSSVPHNSQVIASIGLRNVQVRHAISSGPAELGEAESVALGWAAVGDEVW